MGWVGESCVLVRVWLRGLYQAEQKLRDSRKVEVSVGVG